jgi:hypothetical protein
MGHDDVVDQSDLDELDEPESVREIAGPASFDETLL